MILYVLILFLCVQLTLNSTNTWQVGTLRNVNASADFQCLIGISPGEIDHVIITTVMLDECHGIPNQQQLPCLFVSLLMLTTKKASNLHIIGPWWGKSTSDWWFPSQRANDVENFSTMLSWWVTLYYRIKLDLNLKYHRRHESDSGPISPHYGIFTAVEKWRWMDIEEQLP